MYLVTLGDALTGVRGVSLVLLLKRGIQATTSAD